MFGPRLNNPGEMPNFHPTHGSLARKVCIFPQHGLLSQKEVKGKSSLDLSNPTMSLFPAEIHIHFEIQPRVIYADIHKRYFDTLAAML